MKFKRFLSMFLAVCLTFGMLPVVSLAAEEIASGTCGDSLTWMLDAEGILTISGEGAMVSPQDDAVSSTIPWYEYRSDITAVVMESGVATIGAYAFSGCSNLTDITIADTVTRIEQRAFSGCSSLSSIALPDSLAYIGESAFDGCTGMASITIPANVATMGDYVFDDAIESIYFKGNCPYGDWTFSDVIATVYFPLGNDTWNYDARYNFTEAYGITWRALAENGDVYQDGGTLATNLLWTLDLDYNLVISGSGAMQSFETAETPWCYYDAQIKTVTVEDGVTSIGMYAFKGCKSITAVSLAQSVHTIDGGAFSNCTSLEEITLPEGLTQINGELFYGCSALKSVTLPTTLTGIYEAAFGECTSLTSLVIPENVSYLDGYVFSGAASVVKPVIAEIIFRGDAPTFDSFSGATFEAVTATVYYPADNATWTEDVMQNYGGTITWTPYSDSEEEIPDEETPEENILGSGDCGENLTWTLTDDGTMTISGEGDMTEFAYADTSYSYVISDIPWFDLRDSITGVVIESGVTSVCGYAFNQCTNLTSLSLGDTVTVIGRNAFYGCSGLTQLQIPDSVTEIGEMGFAYCTAVTELSLGEGLTTLNDYAFYQLDALEEVTIPASVQFMDYRVFGECDNLTRVVVSEGVTSLGKSTFSRCPKLTQISIPDSLTEIGDSLFFYCSGLTGVELPDSITSVGQYAFNGCCSMESIVIPANVTSLGAYLFSGSSETSEYVEPILSEITFTGDAPTFESTTFQYVTATAYYPADNETWTEDVMQNYGGTITWTPYGDTEEEIPEDGIIASGTCGENLTWVLDENYVLTISGEGAMDDFTSSTQPWEDYTQQITAVAISNGVTSVGEYAFFHCYDIAAVELADSITSIGLNAFFYCSSLTSVNLSAQLESIGNYAFGSCKSLTEAALPEGLVSIGDKVFANTALTSVLIPEGVTSIGEKVFSSSALTEVFIPASLTSVGASVFLDCTALPFITVDPENPAYCNDEQGAMYNKDCTTLIEVPAGFVGEFVIPDTVTALADDALRNCDGLTGVTIPDSVTEVGERAFYECDQLDNVTLPNSLAEISRSMFGWCESLTSIAIPASVTAIGQMAFSSCTGLTEITFLGDAPVFNSTDVFSNVTATAYYPADNATWTEDVMQSYGGTITWTPYGDTEEEIPEDGIIASGTCGENLTWVLSEDGTLTISGEGEMETFSSASAAPWYVNLDQITAVQINSGVTSVSNYAFYGYTAVTSVSLPDTLTAIGLSAFRDCSALTSVEIPASAVLGNYVFYNCAALESVVIPEVANVGEYCFNKCPELTTAGLIGSDCDVQYGMSGTSIAAGAFAWCTTLTEITLPNNITRLENDAFKDQTDLTAITLPGSVTYLGSQAFYGCTSLTEMVLPDGLTSINPDVFENCTSLERVEIPGSVTSIGDEAFRGCSALTGVSIPDGVTEIGYATFYDCAALTEIVIPDGVTVIGSSAFENCTSLTSVKLSNSLAAISNDVFRGCEALTEISLPDTITSIGDAAFYDCASLQSVNIPNSVTSIGVNAFGECTSLTEMVIPDGVESIGDHAFYSCAALEHLEIADSVTSIGSYAFGECTSLTKITFLGDAPVFNSTSVFSNVTATAYYPADNATWTEDVMQNYGGTITWVSLGDTEEENPDEDAIASGTCGENLTWVLSEDGTLTISGEGDMDDYSSTGMPWYDYRSQITALVVEDGVSSIGQKAFYSYTNLLAAVVGNDVSSIGSYALAGCTSLRTVTLGTGLTYIAPRVFAACSSLEYVVFQGDAPTFGTGIFQDVETACIYPANNSTWTEDVMQDYEGTITWAEGCLEHTVVIDEAVAATCTERGYTEGSHCSECGMIFTAQEVTAPTGHSCETGTCEACGAELSASGTCGEGLSWALDADGTLTVYGIGEMETFSSVSAAPWYVNLDQITAVQINPGVTSVSKYAFYGYTAVASVSLPDTLTAIGLSAFRGCSALISVEIPASAVLGNYVFYNCAALESVVIPDVANVGEYCFNKCPKLTTAGLIGSDCNVQYGMSGTTITSGAFAWCTTLTEITLPNNITSLESEAFKDQTDLTAITLPDSVTYIGYRAFYGCTGLMEMVLPDGLTSIYTSVFENCTGLKRVEIPDSVTSIGYSAFEGCSALTDVRIPDGVTEINGYTFRNCAALTEIVIPDSVTTIGNYAFDNCTGLTVVEIPDSVTTIDQGAFSGCTGLTSVELSDSLAAISNQMFYACPSLTEIYLPDTITTIGEDAFSGCKALRSVSIPDTVTSIGSAAFGSCAALEEIVIPDSVESIGSSAFYDCTALERIEIPDSVTSMGGYMFQRCTSLKEITLPGKITELGDGFFAYCSALTAVEIPAGVTSIGYGAFRRCTGLTEITIPGSVASIGDSAFIECSGLTAVTIGEGVASIGGQAFLGCSGLLEITIPGTVASVGERTFEGCTGLTAVTISEGVASIGNDVFSKCTGLTEIIIPGTVASVGDGAFEGCTGLKSVTIGEGVASIGRYAFQDCTGLTEITIPESVTAIGTNAFWSCNALKEIYVCSMEADLTGTDLPAKTAVFCHEGSAAETFAIENGRDYCAAPAGEALGHNVTSVVTEPTCNQRGYTTHTCQWCGDTYADSYDPALGHDYEGGVCTSCGFACDFSGTCGELVTWTLYEGVLTISGAGEMNDLIGCETSPWYDYRLDITAVVIEEGVTCIGDYAFRDCENLTSVTMANSIDHIHCHVFENCTSLEELTFGAGLTDIHEEVFAGCTGLKTVTFTGRTVWNFNGLNEQRVTCYYPEDVDCWTEIPGQLPDITWIPYTHGDNHIYRVWEYSSGSCTEDRVRYRTCYACDHEERETYEATGHNWSDWYVVNEAGCTYDGSRERYCQACGQWEAENIPATGHNYADDVCTSCGAEKIDAPVITVTNVASTGLIRLSWDAVENAVSYWVSVWTSDGYAEIGAEPSEVYAVSGTSFTYGENMAWDDTNVFIVKAVTKNGTTSELSNVVTGNRKLPRPTVTVSNVASTGKNKISWDEVTAATKYKVYIYEDGKLIKTTTTTNTSITHSSAVAGTAYTYRVRALRSEETATSALSASKSLTCDLARPTITVGSIASTGKPRISWTAVTGAEKYTLYIYGANGNLLKTATTTGTSLTHSSAVAGTTYTYRVQALCDVDAAASARSASKSLTCDLARPTIKVTNVASTGKPRISWAAVKGATKYTLYIYDSDGKLLKTASTTKTSATHSTAVAGETYTYKVRALCGVSAATSAYSSGKSRCCDLARPVVSISRNSSGKPVLTWKAISGAAKYRVYRSTDGENWTLLTTTTKTTITNSKTVAGTTYYYKVMAIHGTVSSANSVYSAVVSVKSR